MLNIPETVKALFKQDGVNKNFRAHFPGGELPDITNDDIVEESVKFQESVCSQNVFRFGLTEASVIEFETVGAGNMYGMTMECFSEIDCSRLTAAELADIQAGTWDGELVLPATSGLDVPVFRVPLGTFRVESCPRDHQVMAHRKVTAYTLAGGSNLKNPYQDILDSLYYGKDVYTPNAEALVMSALFASNPEKLLDYGYTKSSLAPSGFAGAQYFCQFQGKNSYGGTVTYSFDLHRAVYSNTRYGFADETAIATLRANLIDDVKSGIIETFSEIFSNLGFDAIQSGYTDWDSMMEEFWDLLYYGKQKLNVGSVPTGLRPSLVKPLENGERSTAYLYHNGKSSPESRTFTAVTAFIDAESREIIYEYPGETLEWYTPNGSHAGMSALNLLINSTDKKKIERTMKFSFSDSYDLKQIANGWLELTGRFATAARSGGNALLRLSNSSPVAVAPTDYSQMWFDEYEVQPIGTIRYAYTDEAGEEQVVDYQFGDGESVYDMTDNAVLKAMDGASPDVIESLLDTSFIPHLGPVNFTPIDLNMKGLPYLEAGDALAVTAQDGTVCSSYALRRELGGVQALTDQIDSESGLIIDSEEGA